MLIDYYYLVLSQFIFELGLPHPILGNLRLSWANLVFLVLSCSVSDYLGLFLSISCYFWQYLANSDNLSQSPAISGFLETGESKLLPFKTFCSLSVTSYRGAHAPKNEKNVFVEPNVQLTSNQAVDKTCLEIFLRILARALKNQPNRVPSGIHLGVHEGQ